MKTTFVELPPCFKPMPNLLELCANAYRPDIKRLDCKRCIEENKLEDYHSAEF